MSTSAVRVRAYAKVNLVLEVLGRRADGYHDLRTVMQTISLADDLLIEMWFGGRGARRSRAFTQTLLGENMGAPPAFEDNLVRLARDTFLAVQETSPPAGLTIDLDKSIPIAAGLGGGSSDGVAVVRGLNALYGTALGDEELDSIAYILGSDAPFLLRGGTQLAEGRGDELTRLPDLPETWLVLVPQADSGERKTARLFSLLRPEDFGDGSRTDALLAALANGRPLTAGLLCNTFERVEVAAFPELAPVRRAVERVCGHALLCGAGPSLFALAPDEATARAWVAALAGDVDALAVRTVPAEESTAVEWLPAPFA